MMRARNLLPAIVCLAFAYWPGVSSAAVIEFLSGTRLECKILAKDDSTVKVEVQVDGKPVTRVYKLSLIHAVNINDKRHVINEKTAGGTVKRPTPTARPSSTRPEEEPVADGSQRSRAEVEALIKQASAPPDWFDATPTNIPPTLDLSYPEKPEGGWNNQRNIGQYVWDIINPNPNKWREGVKLFHKLLEMHQNDPDRRTRALIELGRMYHNLHEDHARAAFFWRAAGVDKPGTRAPGCSVSLARCYWLLGNRQMAVELLSKLPNTIDAVKLWADMGEMTAATRIGSLFRTPGAGMELALMHVADGYRQQGKLKEALALYQQVLALQAANNQQQRLDRTKARARASIEAIQLFELADVKRVADGVYRDNSLGYEGPVEVEVTVRSGKIENVRVSQHREKQFYSALTDTPAKIIARQGVKGVDATSHATITSEAIINATAKALASGAK